MHHPLTLRTLCSTLGRLGVRCNSVRNVDCRQELEKRQGLEVVAVVDLVVPWIGCVGVAFDEGYELDNVFRSQ